MLRSPFGVTFGSWACFGELRGTFGPHGERLCGPRVVFNDFGGLFWRPGAPFSHSNEDLDAAIATCSFKMFLAFGLGDFLVILECPRT